MSLIIYFILGYVISFVGTTPPSMLNMTTAKITLDKSKNEGIKFALGVSIIVLIQAYIALIFARYIHNNANFEWYLQVVGIFIFILLSFYFFKQAVQERKQEIKSNKKFKNSFVVGLMLSTLNMFAVPFYCGVGSALKMFGLFEFSQTTIIIFVIGSAFGTYSLLYVYASSAIKIQKKAILLTKNLNYILSGLTAVIALITFIKTL